MERNDGDKDIKDVCMMAYQSLCYTRRHYNLVTDLIR